MPRKKIKLITLDLDDTLWPNIKVIVDAENAWLSFILAKFPNLVEEFSEESLSRVRVDLIEKNPSLKNDLTSLKNILFARMTGSGSALVANFLTKKDALNGTKLIKKKYKKHWCISSKTI